MSNSSLTVLIAKSQRKSELFFSIAFISCVKSFIKDNPKGTFIVGVAGHAFTVKDGTLIDNADEKFRPTRKVTSVFQLKSKRSEAKQLSLFA